MCGQTDTQRWGTQPCFCQLNSKGTGLFHKLVLCCQPHPQCWLFLTHLLEALADFVLWAMQHNEFQDGESCVFLLWNERRWRQGGVKRGAGEKRLPQSFPGFGDQLLLLTPGCFPITTRVGSPSFYLEREAPRIACPDTCSHCVTHEVSWEKTPERRPGASVLGVRRAQYGPKHSSLSARRRSGPEGDGAAGNTGHPSSWRQSVSLGEKFQNQEPEQVS